MMRTLRISTVMLLLLMGTACQAATSPSATGSGSAQASATPTAAPTASEPLSMPRPSDLPTDGTCEQGRICLGLLDPGVTYHTRAFRPGMSLSVPDAGWENISDEGGILQLLPIQSPGDAIAVFHGPRAVDPSGTLVPGIDGSAQALADWLGSHDQLDVTPAQPVTIGGLSGLVMDIRISPDATARDPGCPVRACFAYFKGKDTAPRPTWEWDWGSAGTEVQRLYLLSGKDYVLAIFVDSLDGATFESMTAAADKILGTLTFDD